MSLLGGREWGTQGKEPLTPGVEGKVQGGLKCDSLPRTMWTVTSGLSSHPGFSTY